MFGKLLSICYNEDIDRGCAIRFFKNYKILVKIFKDVDYHLDFLNMWQLFSYLKYNIKLNNNSITEQENILNNKAAKRIIMDTRIFKKS